MKVTYIGHSGFLVELAHCSLLFDVIAGCNLRQSSPVNRPGLETRPLAACESGNLTPMAQLVNRGEIPPEDSQGREAFDRGELPELDTEKPVLVFVSHSHRDHYSRSIWELRKVLPRVTYILARDVPFSSGVRNRLQITDEDLPNILRVQPMQTYTLTYPETREIRVETLRSTDQGVAYLVEAEGKTIYHAGDLHLWLWEEEGEEYMADMRRQFDRDTASLAGRRVDCAFLPLDSRLEEHTFDGMDAYLSLMQVSHCFPMHFWKDYDLPRRYKEARKNCPYVDSIHEITHPGQQFSIL